MDRATCLTLTLLTGAACGPAAPPPAAPKPAPQTPAEKLAGMQVYDAAGKEQACAPPETECPPIAPDRAFEQRCTLAGFRVQRCACAAMCSGKAEHDFYDAEGHAKACAPAKDDCQPPQVSAAFQDACVDRGFKLQACGCDAWLCSGDPTK